MIKNDVPRSTTYESLNSSSGKKEAETCKKCSLKIPKTQKSLYLLSGDCYHSSCVACDVCRKVLGPDCLILYRGRFLCDEHYLESRQVICDRCLKQKHDSASFVRERICSECNVVVNQQFCRLSQDDGQLRLVAQTDEHNGKSDSTATVTRKRKPRSNRGGRSKLARKYSPDRPIVLETSDSQAQTDKSVDSAAIANTTNPPGARNTAHHQFSASYPTDRNSYYRADWNYRPQYQPRPQPNYGHGQFYQRFQAPSFLRTHYSSNPRQINPLPANYGIRPQVQHHNHRTNQSPPPFRESYDDSQISNANRHKRSPALDNKEHYSSMW